MLYFMTIRPAQPSCSTRTDRQTDKTKLIVAFRNFANAPKNTWYEKTNSTEKSPSWEANSFSASQEIPRILRNPKFHCRIHYSPL